MLPSISQSQGYSKGWAKSTAASDHWLAKRSLQEPEARSHNGVGDQGLGWNRKGEREQACAVLSGIQKSLAWVKQMEGDSLGRRGYVRTPPLFQTDSPQSRSRSVLPAEAWHHATHFCRSRLLISAQPGMCQSARKSSQRTGPWLLAAPRPGLI